MALSFQSHAHHVLAKAEFDSRSPGNPPVVCRSTEQSWLRLLTNPSLHRLYQSEALTNRTAVQILSHWLKNPAVRLTDSEPPGTRDLWLELAARDTASPKVWMDAYLAAFAISGGLTFTTLDQDFRAYTSQRLNLQLLITDH